MEPPQTFSQNRLTIEDLYDLDPAYRVSSYLNARELSGITHRNVDTVEFEGGKVYITTAHLQRLVDEVTELRRDNIILEAQLDDMTEEVDRLWTERRRGL